MKTAAAVGVIALSVFLSACGGDTRVQQAAKCELEEIKTYPSDVMAMSPEGQHFMKTCMLAAGYDFVWENKSCVSKVSQETRTVINQATSKGGANGGIGYGIIRPPLLLTLDLPYQVKMRSWWLNGVRAFRRPYCRVIRSRDGNDSTNRLASDSQT